MCKEVHIFNPQRNMEVGTIMIFILQRRTPRHREGRWPSRFSSMPEEAFSWDCGTQAWSQSPHLVGILITLPPRVTVRLGTCELNLRRAPSVAMCSVSIFRRNQAIQIGLETLKPQHTQVTAGEPADLYLLQHSM